MLRFFLTIFAAASLGGFFIIAGATKIPDVAGFYGSILNYKIIGAGNPAWFIALTLPWLELIAGTALLFPATRSSALALILAMLAFFQVLLAVTLFRGLDIQCGCSGGSTTSTLGAFLRNWLLIGLGLMLASGSRRSPKFSRYRLAK